MHISLVRIDYNNTRVMHNYVIGMDMHINTIIIIIIMQQKVIGGSHIVIYNSGVSN